MKLKCLYLSLWPDPEEAVHKLREEPQFLWIPISASAVDPADDSKLTPLHSEYCHNDHDKNATVLHRIWGINYPYTRCYKDLLLPRSKN